MTLIRTLLAATALATCFAAAAQEADIRKVLGLNVLRVARDALKDVPGLSPA